MSDSSNLTFLPAYLINLAGTFGEGPTGVELTTIIDASLLAGHLDGGVDGNGGAGGGSGSSGRLTGMFRVALDTDDAKFTFI